MVKKHSVYKVVVNLIVVSDKEKIIISVQITLSSEAYCITGEKQIHRII